MPAVLSPPEIELPPDLDHGGNDSFDKEPPHGGGDPFGRGGFPLRHDPYKTAVWFVLVPVVLFFVGLAGSLLARRGEPSNWAGMQIPNLVYLNTCALLASSITFEVARNAMEAGSRQLTLWLWITAGLGVTFLAGQVAAWHQLAARGMLIASNAGSAFFYIMSASHGTHLSAALVPLIWLSIRQVRHQFTPERQSALRATAVFWHFMAAIWLFVLALLQTSR